MLNTEKAYQISYNVNNGRLSAILNSIKLIFSLETVSRFLGWLSGQMSVVNFRLTSVLPVQSQNALLAPW